MRIAYLINQYPTVSHTFIRREIVTLEQLGHEVMRIALRGWDAELVDADDQRERERTHYVLRDAAGALCLAVIRMLVARPLRFVETLRLVWRMSRRSERSVLIHLVYMAEACRVEQWMRAAKVQHLHAHFGTNSAEVAMLAQALGGPGWSFTAHGTESFDAPQQIGIGEKIRRSTFALAVCSYGRAQLYRWVQHQHWRKIHVVRCGIDPRFAFAAQDPTASARLFVCVGRLSEEKGQLLLLDAARQLAGRGLQFELILAGDGPLRSQIEAVIARDKLGNMVRVTGWIAGQDVRNLILSSRALVVPSFGEGLPVVIMEAMALKRPVIATCVGGVPELVVPGKTGWVVPAGDVEALARAMEECLGSPSEVLSRLGEAARSYVLERHDIEREVACLATIFERAIASKGME